MIRLTLSSEISELLNKITKEYDFKKDSITSRIAIAYSISLGKVFNDDEQTEIFDAKGKEISPTSNIFGKFINDKDNYIIYKTIFDQHYNEILSEEKFIILYKLHLKHGLLKWSEKIENSRDKYEFLTGIIHKNLDLRKNESIKIQSSTKTTTIVVGYSELLSLTLGTHNDIDLKIEVNNTDEANNANIAIAGMSGSGKTQLIKDLLYQIAKKSNAELKFIFFDYKGEGKEGQLHEFLIETDCKFIDIIQNEGIGFNPLSLINIDSSNRQHDIRKFVETVKAFYTDIGIKQENLLMTIIGELFDVFDKKKSDHFPDINDLFLAVKQYYEDNKIKDDVVVSAISSLADVKFKNSIQEGFLNKSHYLNLPEDLPEKIRQLIVFFLLKHFSAYFSGTNDAEIVNENISVLRYVIVIDEAHVYLKNKDARKILEQALRTLRSKGVMIILISQGIEDYKTKDFDFSSQIQFRICLDINNKDVKKVKSFIGDSVADKKLSRELQRLEKGTGLINYKELKLFTLRQFHKTIASK